MLELIAQIVLISSLGGITIILLRKIPVLSELPEENIGVGETLVSKLTVRIRGVSILKSTSFESFLQKILSKIKILTLKIESKTSFWLEELRTRAQKKKIYENDNYWKELNGKMEVKENNRPRAKK